MSSLIILAVLGSVIALIGALWPLRVVNTLGCVVTGIVLIACIGLAYWTFGGWRECRAYAIQLAKQQKAEALLATMRNPQTVIQRMKSHLAEHPQSAKGWYLLGRLYASQHKWPDAKLAFAKAHQLRPNDEQISINLAQSLLALGQEKDAVQARALLKRILSEHPAEPDALVLLAMDAYTHKSYQAAIDYWQRLLTLLPPDSEEAGAIRRAIADANEKLK